MTRGADVSERACAVSQALARVLLEERTDRDLERAATARAANMSPRGLDRIERAERGVGVPTLVALGDALGLPASELLARAERLTGEGRS